MAASSPADGGVAGAATTIPAFLRQPGASFDPFLRTDHHFFEDAEDVPPPFHAQEPVGYAGSDGYADPPYSFGTSDDGFDGDEDVEAGDAFYDASSTATTAAPTENSNARSGTSNSAEVEEMHNDFASQVADGHANGIDPTGDFTAGHTTPGTTANVSNHSSHRSGRSVVSNTSHRSSHSGRRSSRSSVSNTSSRDRDGNGSNHQELPNIVPNIVRNDVAPSGSASVGVGRRQSRLGGTEVVPRRSARSVARSVNYN
jgi:hypothetical protein